MLDNDSANGLANPRVLIVEDDADSAWGLERLLVLFGHDVKVECDGLRAVESAAAFAPHAVLIDLSLPNLDGCAVAARMRKQPSTRECLLVAITGWDDEAHHRATREAGFDLHLVKPLTSELLIEALSALHQSPASA